MLRTGLLAIGILLSVGLVAAAADDLKVGVTVREPVGVARQAEPACGGIPFKKGQVKSVEELALFDSSGKPVPAQFTKLAGYEDGSVQWALVDFRATVQANGAAEFVVKPRGPEAASAGAGIKVTERAEAVTVNTGVLEFTVSKAQFNLFDSVKVNGVAVTGKPAPRAVRLVALEGGEFSAGAPDKVTWEYNGPERVTLRVDGAYRNDKGDSFLSYTTRLTAWAGSSALRIDHAVRNSSPKNGFDAKIKEATLSVPLAFAVQEQGKSYDWIAGGDGKVGVLGVNRNSGGCFPGESTYSHRKELCQTLYKQAMANGRLEVAVIPPADTVPAAGKDKGMLCGYDDGRTFFALADCAHKNSQITLDFYAGTRDAAANAAREKALRSPLHALADGAWISETESLGIGHFGTLADEIATYQKWGWKNWDDPKKQPHSPAQPRAYVAREKIHWTTEADAVEGFTLMYIRTGERGFLDWARAWAEFGVTHYAYRTDAFTFSNARASTLGIGWNNRKKYEWTDSRSEGCHYYAAGLFDYYCLTGEVDVLEGAKDLVEQAVEWMSKHKKGGSIGTYGPRGFSREWLAILRQAQLTRDPADRKEADRLAEVAFTCADWDPRGFVNWGAGTEYMLKIVKPAMELPRLQAYMKEQGITLSNKGIVTDKSGASWPIRGDGGSWEQTYLQRGLECYYRMSGAQEAKTRAIQMAKFARDYEFGNKCQQVPYIGVFDFPKKDKPFDLGEWDDAHKNCPGPGAKHSGWYTRSFIDVFTRAYSLTGDTQWLEVAKAAWNRGSKRGYQTTASGAPDDEVLIFAFCGAPGDDGVASICRMFYEVPRAK